MSKLFVLIGLPGSGKTTLANKMRRKNPHLRVVSSDSVRNDLGLPYSKFDNEMVFEEVNNRLEAFLDKGADVVLDSTNLEHKYRRHSIEVARTCGATVIALLVNTPYEVCLSRNFGRMNRAQIPNETLRQMKDKFDKTVWELMGFDEIRYTAPQSVKGSLLHETATNVILLGQRKPKS